MTRYLYSIQLARPFLSRPVSHRHARQCGRLGDTRADNGAALRYLRENRLAKVAAALSSSIGIPRILNAMLITLRLFRKSKGRPARLRSTRAHDACAKDGTPRAHALARPRTHTNTVRV